MQNRNNLSVRLIKRPRGAPGPRKQLSVRQKLSVREVPPTPQIIKRPRTNKKSKVISTTALTHVTESPRGNDSPRYLRRSSVIAPSPDQRQLARRGMAQGVSRLVGQGLCGS